MYKVYIVEDDPAISDILRIHLEKWGFTAKITADFSKVVEEFLAFAPHIVLLDISLPFFSGFHWCQEIRKISGVPVIFISSAGDDMSLIMAMNMGGDDFISKPFHLEVATAKIQAILRRTYDLGAPQSLLEYRGAAFNPGESTITFQGRKIDLTKNEQRILLTLWENKETVVSRDVLIRKLWDDDSFVDDNTLTVNMTRLRRKLEELGLSGFISTKKGLGYILEEP